MSLLNKNYVRIIVIIITITMNIHYHLAVTQECLTITVSSFIQKNTKDKTMFFKKIYHHIH